MGRKDRNARRDRRAGRPVPRLGRRRALWRFVGAMALAPLSGAALGQDVVTAAPGVAAVPPAYVPGYPPGAGGSPVGGGYVTPAGAAGPFVAPPPMMPGGPGGVATVGGGGGIGGIPITGPSAYTPRLVVDNAAGDGLGWDEGYTAIGGWVPLGLNTENAVIYVDARGFASYQTAGGGNFLLGGRYYVPGMDRFFGVYGGYDIDAGNANSQTFSRVGVGVESVGRYLQYRVNGYIPVGDESKVVSDMPSAFFFRQNNIFFQSFTRYQYGGVDGELGGPLPVVGKYGLSGYLGGYWLTSDVDDTVGFRGRVEANINDDLQVGGKVTQDDLFGTNAWATVTIRSPRGSWSNFFRKDWLRQPTVQTRMDRSPEREYRISTRVNTQDVLAINPVTGLPYQVLHVDPGAAGTGTFENPAGAIAGFNNPGFDIIYVQPGTIATNGPVVLFDNQRLLSTAVPHTFATQKGTFVLPGFTGGNLPVLRNSQSAPSAVIVLANNNEVSGFAIDGTGSPDPFTGAATFHTGVVGNGITSFDINRDTFTNVSAGTVITHVGAGHGVFSRNTLTGFGFGSSLGFSAAAINGSSLGLVANGNTITGFVGEDTDANGVLSPGEDTNGNGVLDPGYGINLVSAGGSAIDAQVYNNDLSANGTGLRTASFGGSNLDLVATGNTIDSNAQAGATVEANASTTTAAFLANRITNNQGPGVNAVGTVASNVLLTLGGAGAPLTGNFIDNNAGADVALTLATASQGHLFAYNNQISNARDDGNPLTRFTGQGIDLLVTDDAALLDSQIDANLIANNAAEGIRLTADTLAAYRNVVIGNLDGDNNNGNLITGNGDGIRFIRTGNARYDFFRIDDNEIRSNGDNNSIGYGIDFLVDGGLLDIADVFVHENNIVSNQFDGIHGLVQSSGIINLDLRNNNIASNGDDGVRIEQNRFTINQAGVTGIWAGNFIADNRVHGIDIGAPMLDLQVGTTDLGNVIVRNGFAGVFLPGPGTASFTSNLIAQNGAILNASLPVAQQNTAGAGVDIQGVGFKNFTFTNNRIVQNFGDGVEIGAGTVGFSQFFSLNFTNDVVAQNTGRGYDILNAGGSQSDITIRGTAPGLSVIAENGREGVYVVNTASFNQTQSGPTPVVANPDTDPTHGMDATGSVIPRPVINFTFIGNQVVGNGRDQTSTIGLPTDSVGGTGLVFRIGTSDGGFSDTFEGGFATDGFGGVVAIVTDNFFSGNFGADVYAESFTSTVNPTTGTTWSATDYNPTGYQSDPLARFDLTFVNNTYETVDFNNLGAFYNNGDGTFKSRLTTATPPGPFSSATRRRNAQRLADRSGLPPFTGPNVPGEPFEFEYPGMGESTFRISQATLTGTNTVLNPDGTTTIVPAFAPFLLDFQPYTSFFDANGVFLPGAIFGELPYGWSVIP